MVKKITLYKNFNIKTKHRNSIILIGNFDGLHLGHQTLFRSAKKLKKKQIVKLVFIPLIQFLRCFLTKN